jgi:hypothetical protein
MRTADNLVTFKCRMSRYPGSSTFPLSKGRIILNCIQLVVLGFYYARLLPYVLRPYRCTFRGLCDELNTRLEEPYRMWCVFVCDLLTS